MRLSRLGILVLITITIAAGSSCSYYNRVMSRMSLVDGSKAYQDRQFDEAEQLFRDAISRDPDGETLEGRMAQLFLARTLHSEYIGNRQDKAKAAEAIEEYKKALRQNPDDQSSYKAIASLYENLQMNDEWLTWVTERSQNQSIRPEHRAEALVSLAAKQNTCANDITDTEETKKTVEKEGERIFQFVKPADPNQLTQLKTCIDAGMKLIDEALSLETEKVRNPNSIDPPAMSDEELKSTSDELRVFESARSYKASLLIQAMRTAEMEGRMPDRDSLKTEAEAARERFRELSEKVKELQAEIDKRAEQRRAEAAGPAGRSAENANSAPAQ